MHRLLISKGADAENETKEKRPVNDSKVLRLNTNHMRFPNIVI